MKMIKLTKSWINPDQIVHMFAGDGSVQDGVLMNGTIIKFSNDYLIQFDETPEQIIELIGLGTTPPAVRHKHNCIIAQAKDHLQPSSGTNFKT